MRRYIKILIVDDEPQNIKIIREMLRFHPKFECREALSGEEALTVLDSFFPEIILLDVMMSGMNGYEVCKHIRSLKEHKFAKIIMISGMTLIDDRLKGYDAGADDYLSKPFVEEELLAKLIVYSKLNRMEELDALKTNALNILSHETRTPLNGIILGSELLGGMECLNDKAKQYVELVRESGLKIQDLVEKITRYYCIKDGVDKKLSKNGLHGALSNVISVLCGLHEIDSEGVRLECDKTISFFADWSLLNEAFGYVIDNALKNSPDPGSVSVTCRKENVSVFIQVGDRGPGVAPSSTEKVFDALFSSDLLHHRQGTGLSLAIAKEIIEDHDGRITCRNRAGGGACFEIIIKEKER